MYRGAYIWEGVGGAYNLLDVFFVYKPMVPPEYNWPEGWGGGGGGRAFKWKVHWTAYEKQFTTYENPIKRKMWSGFWCYMFLFRAIMQKSEHANMIVNSTLQLCAALQL